MFIDTYRTKFGTIREPLLLEILFLNSVKIPILNMIHQTAELFRVHTHTEYIMRPRCALLIGIIWLLFVRVIKILTDIFNPFITLSYSTFISSQISKKYIFQDRDYLFLVWLQYLEQWLSTTRAEFLAMAPKRNNHSFHL